MLSKPVWSWLDALVAGLLLVAGTSAMVEARNRVVLDTPDMVDLANSVQSAAPASQPTRLCAISSPTGDIAVMPYASQAAVALTEIPLVSCPD